jgi:KilA-N domain
MTDEEHHPMSALPEIMGRRVAEDEHGNVSLTDLYEIAGRPDNLQPAQWKRHKKAIALKTALDDRIVCNTHNDAESVSESTYYVVGKSSKSRTFAHPVLALEYAQTLSPDLGIEVNQVFLRYRSKDVTLALEILEGMAEQIEYDDLRVKLRNFVKEHNKLSAAAAQAAGVTDFPAYNGAGLAGLYGGLTKAQVLERKGLPEDAHHLDYAGHEELAANYFKATQAAAKLKRDKIHGQVAANQTHRDVGRRIRKTIEDIGGTMTEDEPALEHIRAAEKRLKAVEPKEQQPKLPSRKRKSG